MLLLLTFGLHLYSIGRESLWRDEVDTLHFAADIWEQLKASGSLTAAADELAGYLVRPGWNGPLYFLAMEPWLQLAGRSELALRFPSVLAGLAAVTLSYALGARLFGRLAGQLTALLMAINPYLAWYAGEGKMYTLVIVLALLSTYLLLRACASGKKSLWPGYVLAVTLLFYTHILTPLLLPVQAILVLLLYPHVLRSPAVWLSAGAITLPYLPLLLWQWPQLAQPAETGFAFVPLPTMAQRLGEVFGRGIIGWPAAIPLGLLLGAMGVGVVGAAQLAPPQSPPQAGGKNRGGQPPRRRPPARVGMRGGQPPRRRPPARVGMRGGLGLVLWAAVPVLELYLISLRRPLFTERYLIWTLPAWLLLAAGGLAALARRGNMSRWLALGWTAGLVTVGLIGVGKQWSTPVRADFRSAAAVVSGRYQAGELIVFQIPYLQATFDYYAPQLDYLAAEGPYTNWGSSPAEVDAYLRQATAGHARVWLLLSEAAMWDARGLTTEWFQAHGRQLRQVALNRVKVTQWEIEAGPE